MTEHLYTAETEKRLTLLGLRTDAHSIGLSTRLGSHCI